MASCARGVWGKPSRSACEVTLGRGHWAGNATCRSAGPGAQVGAGEEAASQTSSPLKPVPTGGLGARAAQACRHIHLISCPLQTRAFSCYTLALASSSPATRGSPTQRWWAKCPSHRAWGGCPGFSIGEGTLISQDTCLIWQNLCRKSASALPERKGESSEGRYLALAISPYLAEKVLERYRLHLASEQRGLAPVETEAVRSAAAEANTVRWEGGRRGGRTERRVSSWPVLHGPRRRPACTPVTPYACGLPHFLSAGYDSRPRDPGYGQRSRRMAGAGV